MGLEIANGTRIDSHAGSCKTGPEGQKGRSIHLFPHAKVPRISQRMGGVRGSSGWLNEAAARRGKGMFGILRMDGCVVDLPLIFSTLADRRPADGLALRSTINLYTTTMHIKKVPRTPS